GERGSGRYVQRVRGWSLDLVHVDVTRAAPECPRRIPRHRRRLVKAQQTGIRWQVRARGAAEQAIQWQPRHLTSDVPERHVDGGQRMHGWPRAPDAMQIALQIINERVDRRGV